MNWRWVFKIVAPVGAVILVGFSAAIVAILNGWNI